MMLTSEKMHISRHACTSRTYTCAHTCAGTCCVQVCACVCLGALSHRHLQIFHNQDVPAPQHRVTNTRMHTHFYVRCSCFQTSPKALCTENGSEGWSLQRWANPGKSIPPASLGQDKAGATSQFVLVPGEAEEFSPSQDFK